LATSREVAHGRKRTAGPWEPETLAADFVSCSRPEQLPEPPADVLRKGDPLLILLRQCDGSYVGQQAVIANYKEKKLLRTVLRARKEAGSDVPAEIARIAARILINAIVDQITLQRSKHQQFRSREARQEIREALLREFSSSQRAIESVLEASLTDHPVKRFKSSRIVRTPKMDAKAVALMPLASKPKVPTHAPR
jgi:hypothetical protein